jgi:hypothetical protein
VLGLYVLTEMRASGATEGITLPVLARGGVFGLLVLLPFTMVVLVFLRRIGRLREETRRRMDESAAAKPDNKAARAE